MQKFEEDVRKFFDKMGLPTPTRPRLLPEDIATFRTRCLVEEVGEFRDACAAGDLNEAADALADLMYFTVGTFIMMGIPIDRVWDEVQRANMQKERAKTAADSKRGHHFDVTKPLGWTAPNHEPALLSAGWVR